MSTLHLLFRIEVFWGIVCNRSVMSWEISSFYDETILNSHWSIQNWNITRITKPSSWLHTGPPKIQTLCREHCPTTPCTTLSAWAMPTALGSPFHGSCSLVQTLSLTPSYPPPTQLRAVPSGPVTVPRNQSSAWHLHSPHEEARMRPLQSPLGWKKLATRYLKQSFPLHHSPPP